VRTRPTAVNKQCCAVRSAQCVCNLQTFACHEILKTRKIRQKTRYKYAKKHDTVRQNNKCEVCAAPGGRGACAMLARCMYCHSPVCISFSYLLSPSCSAAPPVLVLSGQAVCVLCAPTKRLPPVCTCAAVPCDFGLRQQLRCGSRAPFSFSPRTGIRFGSGQCSSRPPQASQMPPAISAHVSP